LRKPVITMLRRRFRCQPECTACCRQRGFVHLTEDDLRRAASFIGIAADEFERKYVYRTAKRMRFRIPRGGTCPFLEETGCAIHPVKPAQCRIFPFWPELLESAREWRSAARYCPGMAKGRLVNIELARADAGEMRRLYPALYPGEGE
jgi:uncharacterized protein